MRLSVHLSRFAALTCATLTLSACAHKPEQAAASKPEGDPCHLPYLDGKEYFVAAIDLNRGSGKETEKPWSSGPNAGAVDVSAPVDGFPKGGKMKAILVLSSHYPTEWRIDPALAKMTGAVMTAGFNEQRVLGLDDSVPVAHASHEKERRDLPSCVAMTPLFAENKSASRFFTVNSVVDAMLSLGVDRYYEAKSASKLSIPPKADPFQVKK